MPWTKNDDAYTNLIDIQQALNNAERLVRAECYRSRRPLDTALLKFISLPFHLFDTHTEWRNHSLRLWTHAMPREESVDESIEKVLSWLDDHSYRQNASRNVSIINIANYNTPAAQLVEKLIEERWEEKDFRAALTCTPFHTVRLFVKIFGNCVHPQVCIITNDISDDLLLKLSAVLPAIHGFTIPEPLAAAYIECDKAKFYAALEASIQDIIAERKRAELEAGLASLQRILAAQNRVDREQDQIRNYDDMIRSLTSQISDYLKAKQECMLKVASTMWGAVDTAAEQFVNYLKETALPYITAMRCPNNNIVDVQIISELLYWDDEIFRRYTETTRDNVYTNASNPMQAFFRDLLLDKRIKLIFHTAVRIDFSNNTIQSCTGYLGDQGSDIGMPHPHTQWFDCWGNNKAPIVKALGAQDYIVAWEQIRSALSGLNMSDTAVLNRFSEKLRNACKRIPCIVVKDTGERLNYEQYRTKYPNGVPVIEVAPEPAPVPKQRRRKTPEVAE